MPRDVKENRNIYAILGMLSHEPLTGYDLKKRIEVTISYFWPDLSFSKIYPNLKKLESKRLVKMKEIKGGNRPDRKIYHITNAGREKLSEWLSQPIDVDRTNNLLYTVQELLLKVHFGGLTSVDDTMKFIEQSKNQIQKSNSTLKLFEQNLRANLDNDIDHNYFLLTVLLGIVFTKTIMTWSDKAIKSLRQLKNSKNK